MFTLYFAMVAVIVVIGSLVMTTFIANLSWQQFAISSILSFSLLALGGLVFFRFAARATQPILELKQQTEQLDKNSPPPSEKIVSDNEIGDLAEAIYKMAADLELQNRSVKYLAFHDALTGLSNRANFQMQLEDKIVDAANHRQPCFLIYLDIDDFKEINDSRGHEYGDRALRILGNRLSSCVDTYTSKQGSASTLLARVGGDEFTVLVTGKLKKQDVGELAESLLEQANRPFEIDGALFQLSGSIGIAGYPKDALSASALFNSADMAMYASKHAGKGTYRFFTEAMSDQREILGQIKTDFGNALEKPGEIELAYQPIVDINSGRIIGAEALIRWNHPQKGILYPEQFISVVEHNEIALKTDLWILDQVANLLTKVDLSARPEFRVAANISASNLAREQFGSAVSKQITETPEVARYLQLEVTETYLHRDEECAQRTLSQLKEIGIPIWLDDFCTGYSSLQHISIFPVDGIKIDRKFIHNISEHENNQLLVSALVNLAESFDIGLIAEGLESTDDLHYLQNMGCLYAQGFLFSKPVSESELIKMIEDDRALM